jgi:very-short-patch-repair endonuclease
VARARSASEAFLFRRLETHAETKGQFKHNTCQPIVFDGQSEMEVDFVSERLRLAIELDGEQHLSNAEAYRRDRRKDRLLQQNGYLVLRFLAEDLGKNLDGVLDSILQVLAGRQRSASTS